MDVGGGVGEYSPPDHRVRIPLRLLNACTTLAPRPNRRHRPPLLRLILLHIRNLDLPWNNFMTGNRATSLISGLLKRKPMNFATANPSQPLCFNLEPS